jgi:hypothetical protein
VRQANKASNTIAPTVLCILAATFLQSVKRSPRVAFLPRALKRPRLSPRQASSTVCQSCGAMRPLRQDDLRRRGSGFPYPSMVPALIRNRWGRQYPRPQCLRSQPRMLHPRSIRNFLRKGTREANSPVRCKSLCTVSCEQPTAAAIPRRGYPRLRIVRMRASCRVT